jgi:predicted PurR-regulated permease PerM
VLLAAGLYASILAYEVISTIALSFLLIFFISLAVNPFVVWLREIFGKRSVGVAIVIVAFLIGTGMAMVAFSTPLRNSGPKLVDQFTGYWQKVQQRLAQLDGKVTGPPSSDQAGQNSASKGTTSSSASSGQDNAKPGVFQTAARESLNKLLSTFQKSALNVVSLLVIAVTVFFGTIFTLLDPYPIASVCFAVVPERYHPQAVEIFKKIALFVPRWAIATLLAMLVIGMLVFLSMWPLLGFGNALTLGLISGTLESVPYLGALVSSIPGLLLAMSKGDWMPLWVLLVYLAVYSAEAYVIAPLIMADRLDVHPVAVIFSVFICGAAFGVLGVLIAVPVLVIVQILYAELYRPHFLPHISTEDLSQMAHAALQPHKRKK